MEENKIEKDLNKFEAEQSKAVKSKDVKEMPKMPIKKKKKKPEKSGYRRIKRPGGGVTYTRRKKPLKPIKKKRKR